MPTGRITIITGPMFSEKSGELIRRCQKLIQYGHRKVVAYKPAEDNRYAKDEIVSRIGYRLPAISIPKKLTDELVQRILEETKDADVVAFDEVQFFSRHIMMLVEELAYCGKHVIADGLNLDYRGKEFGYVGGLLAMADDIEKLASFCAVCGSSQAVYTQRMVNGKPSTVGPIVMIGDSEAYEPRCRNCFIPPHKVNCD